MTPEQEPPVGQPDDPEGNKPFLTGQTGDKRHVFKVLTDPVETQTDGMPEETAKRLARMARDEEDPDSLPSNDDTPPADSAA